MFIFEYIKERLTDKRTAKGVRDNYAKLITVGRPRDIIAERYLKLFDYEETGLTPKEIIKLKEELK